MGFDGEDSVVGSRLACGVLCFVYILTLICFLYRCSLAVFCRWLLGKLYERDIVKGIVFDSKVQDALCLVYNLKLNS